MQVPTKIPCCHGGEVRLVAMGRQEFQYTCMLPSLLLLSRSGQLVLPKIWEPLVAGAVSISLVYCVSWHLLVISNFQASFLFLGV